jgi:hypothetical protein
MKMTSIIMPAIAAFGFALMSHAAFAETALASKAGAESLQKAPSTFTLIRRGGGMGGMRATRVRGGGMRGPRFAAVRTGPRGRAAVVRGGNRTAFIRGRRVGGRFVGGRRVRYWRNGRWWWGPTAAGIGVGAGGGSCYWNCRNAGHGPGFCRAYAFNYCY